MAKFDNHPTVKWWREQSKNNQPARVATLNSDSLRNLCLEMGADDVGFVEIDRPAISASSRIASQTSVQKFSAHFPHQNTN